MWQDFRAVEPAKAALASLLPGRLLGSGRSRRDLTVVDSVGGSGLVGRISGERRTGLGLIWALPPQTAVRPGRDGRVYGPSTPSEWTVAVKLMTAEFSKDSVSQWMKREARIAGRLQEHSRGAYPRLRQNRRPNVFGDAPGGGDLDSVLKRFGLRPHRAVAIITQNRLGARCRTPTG